MKNAASATTGSGIDLNKRNAAKLHGRPRPTTTYRKSVCRAACGALTRRIGFRSLAR
jgi:hypothetical protein